MMRGLVLAVLLAFSLAAQGAERVVVKVKAPFPAAKEAVETAIGNRGMIVNNVSHVGDMLERTGKDTGLGGPVFGTAEVLEFCSAVVSRRMMEADPHNIVFCPYTVAVYTLPGAPDTSYLSYRLPPRRKDLKAVEVLLRDIVNEAADSLK